MSGLRESRRVARSVLAGGEEPAFSGKGPTMATNGQERQEEATYLTLIGIFFALFAAFWKRDEQRGEATKLSGLDLTMLGLSTFRTGRLISYDQVTEPLRAPFTETEPDSYGTGEDTVPEGAGVRKAIGSLLACPTCSGTWVAAALVYGLRVAPVPTRLFLAIMSAVGLAEVFNSANEALSWTGSAERKQANPPEQ